MDLEVLGSSPRGGTSGKGSSVRLKGVDLYIAKDADPEVARLLDPARRGDDPALQAGASGLGVSQ